MGGALIEVRAQADEIRLKDGKKLYGVIVAYEDNMFKVKTDFGFVLVEKDKIAAIIPTAAAAATATKSEPPPAKKAPEKPEAVQPATPASAKHKEEPTSNNASPAVAVTNAPKPAKPEKNRSEAKASPPASNSSAVAASNPPSTSAAQPVPEKKSAPTAPTAPKNTNASPTKTSTSEGSVSPGAPALSTATKTPVASSIPVVTAIPPPKSKPVEPPANRESVEGNLYTNYTHGFRMYKPPSWKLIDDARKTIPNAIVGMGTANESTLMVLGEETTRKPLDATATDVEARLRDSYGNYRRISQRKTVAGGFPAVEIHYRGLADGHDWSGTLLIVSRSGDMFSILGMTYSDTDLIQIQENVIARAMASLEFNSN
jgi:hypothetical protein